MEPARLDATRLGERPARLAGDGWYRPEPGRVPGGLRAKAVANLATLDLLAALDNADRPATVDERHVLAAYSGWGALPYLFTATPDPAWGPMAERLRDRLTNDEWAQARASTLNAHYTDPTIATAMWTAVQHLGANSGRVFEPGCGTGNFLGTCPTPDSYMFTGVEIDRVTARIAALLYPHATIRSESLEQVRLPAGAFDLTIGNVPFSKHAPYDPVLNPDRFSLHNYALLKAAHLTRPGGWVVAITSMYSLDATGTRWRQAMGDRCDFAGAVRLPTGAHHDSAGTDAVTDIVLFRRRPAGAPAAHLGDWFNTVDVALDGGVARVNEWFAAHPDCVVGELDVDRGMYRDGELRVRPQPGVLADALTAVFEEVTARALAHQPRHQPDPTRPPSTPPPSPSGELGAAAGVKEGSFQLVAGGVHRVVDGGYVAFPGRFKRDDAEIRALIAVRDAVVTVLDVELATSNRPTTGAAVNVAGDDGLVAARAVLNRRYDAYQHTYGPISRSTLSSSIDDETGQVSWRRRTPTLGGFRNDPDFALCLALEHYDDETGTATKAAIFTRRVVAATVTVDRVDDPADALAVVLNERGHIDLTRIAQLLSCTEADAIDRLGDRIYLNPARGGWEVAEQYLAGNVRSKHAVALAELTAGDDRFTRNVSALAAVVPTDLQPAEIDANLGAPWIAPAVIAEFISERLGLDATVDHVMETAQWTVNVPTWKRSGVLLTATYGTGRRDAVSLLEACLNQETVTIYDETDDGRRVRNATETLLVLEKQTKLRESFTGWVWSDPTRAETLARVYNERYNATVLPVWSGAHLRLPGLAAGFTPHPHQLDAVWRIVAGGNTLLAHEVGAGKTATMCIAAIELRRLGLAAKPALVVPNHMLEQFTREFLQLYPAARLLIASKDDTSRDSRARFVARVATGDWDAVLMTHQSFGRLPVQPATAAAYLTERLDELRTRLASDEGGSTRAVKKIERRAAMLEANLAALVDEAGHDIGATFEQTGIDHLFIDEAHYFKNRRLVTNIAGVSTSASKRAEDLATKLRWLTETHPARQVTFATGTPVANSIAEMFTMQSYLQPGRLRELGIDHFDAWAANFATTVTAIELAPDGGSYRTATRFARFQNVPDLLRIYREVADVKRGDELNLTRPTVNGGGPVTVTVDASRALTGYVGELVERAEQIRSRRVRPEDDNLLAVTGDGRRAALDLRLVGRPNSGEPGKIDACADQVAALYRQHHDHRYLDPATGQTHPRAGALQVVFCDIGTPTNDRWNVYDDLRHLLIARAVPAGMIRFIHDAGNDDAKARLFADARNGQIAVLVGSSDKLGVGTNIQQRLIALHHLDAPWRPADLEQREGRILRPGNQNPVVDLYRYVTRGSFDVYMWQTLERKATFLGQLLAARLDSRTVDDIGDATALSYGEVKALASGNPLILEKATLEVELSRLRRLTVGWRNEHAAVLKRVTVDEQHLGVLDGQIADVDDALGRRVDTHGDRFRITVNATPVHDRVLAGDTVVDVVANLHPGRHRIATFAGFDLIAVCDDGGLRVGFDHRALPTFAYTVAEWVDTRPLSIIRRLENAVQRLDQTRLDLVADHVHTTRDLGDAHQQSSVTDPHRAAIVTITSRLAAIDVDLATLTGDTAEPAGVTAAADRSAHREGPSLA